MQGQLHIRIHVGHLDSGSVNGLGIFFLSYFVLFCSCLVYFIFVFFAWLLQNILTLVCFVFCLFVLAPPPLYSTSSQGFSFDSPTPPSAHSPSPYLPPSHLEPSPYSAPSPYTSSPFSPSLSAYSQYPSSPYALNSAATIPTSLSAYATTHHPASPPPAAAAPGSDYYQYYQQYYGTWNRETSKKKEEQLVLFHWLLFCPFFFCELLFRCFVFVSQILGSVVLTIFPHLLSCLFACVLFILFWYNVYMRMPRLLQPATTTDNIVRPQPSKCGCCCGCYFPYFSWHSLFTHKTNSNDTRRPEACIWCQAFRVSECVWCGLIVVVGISFVTIAHHILSPFFFIFVTAINGTILSSLSVQIFWIQINN